MSRRVTLTLWIVLLVSFGAAAVYVTIHSESAGGGSPIAFAVLLAAIPAAIALKLLGRRRR